MHSAMTTQDSGFGYGTPSANGPKEPIVTQVMTPGITVEQYADYVKLPEEYLRKTLKLTDTQYDFNPAVRISYPGFDNKEAYHRLRLALKDGQGDARFHSPPKYLGLRPIPYGLPYIEAARKMGYMILPEGESDSQVMWFNDFPALGLPGTESWKHWGAEWATFLEGVAALLVPVEADDGGERLWSLLRATPAIADRLYRMPVTSEAYKDVGALWKAAVADGEEARFKALIDAQIWAGRSYLANPNRAPRKGGARRALPTVSLREVTKEAESTDEYFVYPMFKRGELTLLVGEAKFSGKTTFVFTALTAALEGRPFIGTPTKRAKVLYLSEQGNNLARAVQTSRINLADEESFRIVQFRDVWRDRWEDVIEGAVFTCEEQGREILPVDTFAAFSKLKGSEENDAGHVASRLEPLKVAAQVHNLAICLVHHSGRDTMIRGSSAFDGTVDTIVHLSRPEGNQDDNIRHIKAVGRCDPLSLNIELTAEGIYVPRGSSDRVKVHLATEALREVLPKRAEDALEMDAVIEAVQESGVKVSESSVRRAVRELVDGEEVIEEGKGVKGDPHRYWRPRSPRKLTLVEGGKEGKEDQETRQEDKGEYSRQTPGVGGGSLTGIEKPPFTLVLDKAGLDDLVAAVRMTNAPVGVDTETTSLAINEAEVCLIQVRVPDLPPYVVDCIEVDPVPLLHVLRDKHLLLHNAVYDLAVLAARYDYDHEGPISDTMLMFQIYYGGTNKPANLKDALKTVLGVEVSKAEQTSDWTGELTPEMLEYAATDVAHLHDLRRTLEAKISETAGHLWPVVDLEHRMAKVTAHMSAVGMPVDEAVFAECVRESRTGADQKLDELDALVTAEVPEAFATRNTKSKTVPAERNQKVNWNSPEQALWAFREVAGVEVKNTNKETLPEIDHPMAVALMDYRKSLDVSKRFRDTKVVEGRVYAKWNQLKARTGRMSCEKPPLQGIPDPLRRAFVAPPGKKLIVSDLSQIEVRVLTTICGDENLRADLAAGRDVHRRVAASIFGKEYDAVADKERKMAKALVFGTLYGMGLAGFTARVNAMTGKNYSSDEVERDFRRPLFAPYPKVKTWMDGVATEYENGKQFSYTRLGRRRLQVPDVPAALNTPIQAGATDVMKAIAVEAYAGRRPEWEIVGLVHDEILLVVPEADAPAAKDWLHEIMISAGGEVVNQGVPEDRRIAVDAGTQICDTWAEKE
jgi:DNA polymerase I-like protein with 3'-5' exonuclease and polymerase domains